MYFCSLHPQSSEVAPVRYMYKKEMMTYFTTPFGFVFLGVFLVLSGAMFTIYNLLGGNADMAGTFDLLRNLSFIIFPILTMRLFAEERKSGTEMLLVTSRLKMSDIVLGKFLAAVTMFIIALAVTLVYVIIISNNGFINVGAIASAYLGFFLLGTSMIAICVFVASLTESQITAAVLSFGLLFLMSMLASFTMSINIPVLTPVLSAFAITTYYDEFTLGILKPGPVFYYIGVIAVFVYLAVANMHRRRYR